jgi:hypothetical protein
MVEEARVPAPRPERVEHGIVDQLDFIDMTD